MERKFECCVSMHECKILEFESWLVALGERIKSLLPKNTKWTGWDSNRGQGPWNYPPTRPLSYRIWQDGNPKNKFKSFLAWKKNECCVSMHEWQILEFESRLAPLWVRAKSLLLEKKAAYASQPVQKYENGLGEIRTGDMVRGTICQQSLWATDFDRMRVQKSCLTPTWHGKILNAPAPCKSIKILE